MTKKQPNEKGPIIVPKTYGFGWTLNFKRRESWWILGGLILFLGGYYLARAGIINL